MSLAGGVIVSGTKMASYKKSASKGGSSVLSGRIKNRISPQNT